MTHPGPNRRSLYALRSAVALTLDDIRHAADVLGPFEAVRLHVTWFCENLPLSPPAWATYYAAIAEAGATYYAAKAEALWQAIVASGLGEDVP